MQSGEKKISEDKREEKKGTLKQMGGRIKERLSKKSEREVRERLGKLVGFLLTALSAYLLSGTDLFLGIFPFSVALACSSRRHLAAIAIGICFASLDGMPIIYGYTCLAILLVRILATLLPIVFSEGFKKGEESRGEIIEYKENALEKSAREEGEGSNDISVGLGAIFLEPLHVKLICAAIGGMISGLFLLLSADFSFYSLMQTMVLLFCVPFFTLLFGGVWGEERYIRDWYRTIALGAILFLAVSGCADKSILGMPMAPCAAMMLTLYVSNAKGIFWGCGVALLCGIAFEPLYIPLMILSAILFCLVSAVKKNAGVAVVCGLVVVWCYYIGGERGLVSVLPPMLLAIPIYMLADRYREMMRAPYRAADALAGGVYFAEAVTERDKNDAVRERLDSLSEVFSSLSETFYKLSDRFRRPDVLGIKKIADSAFEKVCEGCRNRERCWGADYAETVDAVGRVSSSIHKSGGVSVSDLPERFASECLRVERLINEVNAQASATTEKIMKGGKINFFASNYEDITAILKDAIESDPEEYECDIEAAGKIFDYLSGEGLRVGGVVVYGKRCRRVVVKGNSLSDDVSAKKAGEIRKKVSMLAGIELSEPIFEVGKDGGVMLFYTRPIIRASCAHGRISRTGRKWSSGDGEGREHIYVDLFDENDDGICGDMTDAFITDSSYFYSLISDGMGSGANAAYTSGVCAMFIEKMLMAGNRADITIRMLNNVIRSENMGCGDECSATVDLLELDLMSGTAAFIKSGAAPTYIAREGTVYKVSSRTMPVGIIKDADARITKFDTKKGDIIVMMSDGCCHDSEDCPWLVEYLCAYMTRTRRTAQIGDELCETLKDEIMREALKNAPEGEERDDISVSVTVVG